MIDSKVFKLLFFAYKGKVFNAYEKIILVAYWSLITDDFLVRDQPETENIVFDYHRHECGYVKINYVKENIQIESRHFYEDSLFRIRFEFNENQDYKWFAIEYKDFLNVDSTDVEYKMLSLLTKEIQRKAREIFKKFQNEQEQQQ